MQSMPGEGTEFRVALPAAVGGDGADRESVSTERSAGTTGGSNGKRSGANVGNRTKGRILIVDDELVVRDSLGKWFTSEGYHGAAGRRRARSAGDRSSRRSSISRCWISRCRAWTAWNCRPACARQIRT